MELKQKFKFNCTGPGSNRFWPLYGIRKQQSKRIASGDDRKKFLLFEYVYMYVLYPICSTTNSICSRQFNQKICFYEAGQFLHCVCWRRSRKAGGERFTPSGSRANTKHQVSPSPSPSPSGHPLVIVIRSCAVPVHSQTGNVTLRDRLNSCALGQNTGDCLSCPVLSTVQCEQSLLGLNFPQGSVCIANWSIQVTQLKY